MPFVQVAQKSLCLEIFTAFSGLASRRRNPASRILSEKSKSEPSNPVRLFEIRAFEPIRGFGFRQFVARPTFRIFDSSNHYEKSDSTIRTYPIYRIFDQSNPIRLFGYSTNRIGYEKSDAAAVSTGRIGYE